MRNAYDASAADALVAQHPELAEALVRRIHTSRLLGGDPDLVLHGGGNTSVKLRQPDLLGRDREVLCIKGSGHDLAHIGPDGFAPLDLEGLRALRALDALSDEAMENALLVHRLDARAPSPSVETLLHAFLPSAYVDHTHADAILVLSNGPDPEAHLALALGPRVALLPYTMPGLGLAKQVGDAYDAASGELDAIVSLQHGVFTFGDDAETAYTRMIDCVTRAERFLSERGADPEVPSTPPLDRLRAARLVQTLRGATAEREDGGSTHRRAARVRASEEALHAASDPAAAEHCASGVLTPDHAIRTGNRVLYLPAVAEDDEALRASIDEALAAFGPEGARPDLALAPGVGLVALGKTPRDATIAADIGDHTLRAKRMATALGGYVPIDAGHVADMEHWSLQRKKLGGAGATPLVGQVAFVTGAGGAIGAGIAERLLAAGASVAISDVDAERLETVRSLLADAHGDDRLLARTCDVTDLAAVEDAYVDVSLAFGGIDVLVPNAGVAHVAPLEELDPARFQAVIGVNLMGTFHVIRAAIPIFRRQGSGGNVVLISSKNVPDPGAAFGAYSASKAGAHQVAKIAALELAPIGVRVNMVNPDAVFGDARVSSGLWDVVGPDRMRSRGLDPEGLRDYYRERNLLKVQVLAEHVGNAVVFFASELTPTTGASFPVDGGVPSAFPR